MFVFHAIKSWIKSSGVPPTPTSRDPQGLTEHANKFWDDVNRLDYTQSPGRLRKWFKSLQAMSWTQLLLAILVIGVSIIIGFLSFSGMYVLIPILAVAVVAFVLSVGFEGEIYYQNIIRALDKLFKPNYLKRQLAKECLRDLLPKIEIKESLKLIIDKLETTYDCSESLKDDYEKFVTLYEHLINSGSIEQSDELNSDLLTVDEFRNSLSLVSELDARKSVVADLVSQRLGLTNARDKLSNTAKIKAAQFRVDALIAERLLVARNLRNALSKLDSLGDDYPQFFLDYMKFTRLHHQYDHPNLDKISKIEKKDIEENLLTLKELFRTHLFDDDKIPRITLIGQHLRVVQNKSSVTYDLSEQYVFVEEESAIYKVNKQNSQLRFQPFSRQEYLDADASLLPTDQETLDTLIYKTQLNHYLNSHREQRQSKLNNRKFIFQIAQSGSTLAGLFMILGTTYLLVEAFAVIPLVAAIPLGAWPILIVPMAVIAGTAFGLLTYNAVTDLINDDMIMKRYRKIRTDIKKGLTAPTGLMLFVTVSLFALTLALTICTAGTWWTVIKHTRPVFTWMAKISVAIIGIVAASLGVAQFVFNATNTLSTLEEFDEEVGPHPYDQVLLSINAEAELPGLSDKPTLIKHGDKYYADGNTSGRDLHWLSTLPDDLTRYQNSYVWADKQLVYVTWNGVAEQDTIKNPDLFHKDFAIVNPKRLEKIHLSDKQIALIITANGGYTQPWMRTELDSAAIRRIDFSKKILPYSIMNIRVYLAMILNKTHTFIPHHDNIWQLLNPFRLLLKLTYTPLRLALFLGHLISIGAVSDRVPGIPEILSAILGIVAEFFEDWHYFFSFEHAHKDDIGSLMDEQEESGGHDHDDDLPSKALRALFYPLIYLAAWWDSAASDRKEYRHPNLDTTTSLAALFDQHGERAELSFDRALEKNQGIRPAVAVWLEPADLDYVAAAQHVPAAEMNGLPDATALPTATSVSDVTPRLIKNLATMAGQRTPASKELIKLSLFKPKDPCCNIPGVSHQNQSTHPIVDVSGELTGVDMSQWLCQPCP
ncbi:MAG: hypothetical protein Q8R24_05415 [Legionellaceae bacterium]|nr:hypothetical protein [Legionellaceae bacterium]